MSEFKVAGFGRSGGKKTTLSDQEEDFSNSINWSNSSDANRSDKDLGKLKMTHIPSLPLLLNTWNCQFRTAVPAAVWPKGWPKDSTLGQAKARGEARCHPLDWHPKVLESKAYISSWFWGGSFRADFGAVGSPTGIAFPGPNIPDFTSAPTLPAALQYPSHTPGTPKMTIP